MKNWVSEAQFDYINDVYEKVPFGKMIRSQLVEFIADKNDKSIALATSIEMIHLASLFHDDVIDNSTLRRGKPSLNATEGNLIAIMMGDLFYSQAYSKLIEIDPQIASIISQAVYKLSLGEILDVELSKNFNSDEEKYLDMIEKKTAVLLEATTESSAIISNKNRENFKEYGKNLGLAFQIIDDILDITSTEEKLGKPVLYDYVEGKVTLPYIYLYYDLVKNNRNSEAEKLISLHKKELSEDDKNWFFTLMKEFNSVEKTYQKAQEYSEKALNSIKNENNEALNLIVNSLMKRRF
jgi:octaprenyl-diphosphate synthase